MNVYKKRYKCIQKYKLSYKRDINVYKNINYLTKGINYVYKKRYKCLQKDKLCFLQKRNINIYKKMIKG